MMEYLILVILFIYGLALVAICTSLFFALRAINRLKNWVYDLDVTIDTSLLEWAREFDRPEHFVGLDDLEQEPAP